MLVNGNFDSPLVADAAFAERARTPHEHTAAVAQLAVEGFDDAGTGFADDVGSGRQYLPVGPPLVGKVARVPVVATRQCGPQAPQGGRAPRAQHPGRDAPAGALDGQPQPDFAPLAAHERPHFVQFKVFPLPPLRPLRQATGQGRSRPQRFFLPVWQSCCAPRPWRGRCCEGSCARPATGRLGRIAGPFPRRRAGNSPGGRTLCTGTWPARRCGHCAESAHWRTWRNNAG